MKTVVVTGASAGVGRATAVAFGARGDRVALIARGEDGLQAAAREVRAAGGTALVLGAFGIGGAVGSLAMASVRMPRRYLTLMNIGWGLACLPFLVMGAASAVWQVVASGFVMGALFSAPMVIWGTLLQRRVPPELLGRVASLDFFVSVSLMPVSMALAGPVSELLGLQTTFLIAGLAPVVFAVVALLWARLPQDELAHPLG